MKRHNHGKLAHKFQKFCLLLLIQLITAFLLVSVTFCNGQIGSNEVRKKESNHTLIFSMGLIDDIPFKDGNGNYNMVVEIPAGTVEKWEVAKKNDRVMKIRLKKGKPRIIKYLPYPGNYGFIPQTIVSEEKGGDGDPVDVILLSPSVKRGTIKIRIIGCLKYLDKGEIDDKLIAVPLEGTFSNIRDISGLILSFPGAVQIVKLWFDGYKDPGKMVFMGYGSAAEAREMIAGCHAQWEKTR